MATDTLEKNGNGEGKDAPPEVTALAAGDPSPPTANPIVLNDAYFELGGVNLRCLVKHLEVAPENKLVTQTSFCAETDLPGVTKWHLRVDFYQSFDANATYSTLNAALTNYTATGAPVLFKARPYSSRVAASNNPIISGLAVPQPFIIISGDAGALSEVAIDWNLTGPPTVTSGGIPATGATSGAPGTYSPAGCDVPANVAGLSAVTASPTTAWAVGQYVITADLLAAHWTGTAWAAGKA